MLLEACADRFEVKDIAHARRIMALIKDDYSEFVGGVQFKIDGKPVTKFEALAAHGLGWMVQKVKNQTANPKTARDKIKLACDKIRGDGGLKIEIKN